MKGLYVHIPFCNSICSYCDFCKMIAKEEVKENYIDSLIAELEEYKPLLNDVRSVFIGGGTPNSLNDKTLKRLFDALKPYLDRSNENTIEINCELLTPSQIELFKLYNINRISIGVQSIDDKLIKLIGRKHNRLQVEKAINDLNDAGLTNINIDMMYGLPGQTMADLRNDYDFLMSQKIKHFSYYSLILEDKTILKYQIEHNQISIPDDDLVADMAEYIYQKSKKSIFKQYEISNYAIPGYESIHNLGYWNWEEYVGIGLNASGFINGIRYRNNNIITKYQVARIAETEEIGLLDGKKEFMMLGLRKLDGIDINDYYKHFGSYPETDFNIDKLKKLGLLVIQNDNIRIKEEKILLGNIVFEEFVR